MDTTAFLTRLERYTERQRQEVLLVRATVEAQSVEVMVFRGFSSSLTGATAFDPDVPVLPPSAAIQSIDRLQAPYNPAAPQVIAANLSVAEMQTRLQTAGIP